MINKQIIQFNEQQSKPILVKASLRYHSPQQIYDYLYRQIGEVGMKIKKKQAIIGFQNQEYYQKLLKQHRTVMLHGKKLQFVPLAKSDQNYLQSEQQVIQLPKNAGAGGSFTYPQFQCKSVIQAKINKCRYDMLDKVQQLFNPTIEVCRQRSKQLVLQFRQKGPQQREIFSLQSAVQKKLKLVQNKYETQVQKIIKFVRQFSTKPSNIDLQPTFAFQENFQFPRITQRNMRFQPAGFYANKDNFPCKRLCAINGNQFAVSMTYSKRLLGRVRLYDVNSSDSKKTLDVNPGGYGICRVNNFLIIGSCDQSLKYLNLEDKQQCQVDSSQKLSQKANASFFDLKLIKHSTDKPEIITLCTDYIIRKFQLSIQEMGFGLYTIFFTQKQNITVNESCITFQVINPVVILYGKQRSLIKYQMQKKMTRQVKVSDKPIKIKKFNNNLYAVASNKVVELVDSRTQAVVQTFSYMPKQMRSLQVIGQHSLMYGGLNQIGLLDDRKHQVFPWKSIDHHKGIVYDILKLKQRVISCDSQGSVYSWKLADGQITGKATSNQPIDIQ